MTIIADGKKYTETRYSNEKEFEEDVIASSKVFFGKGTIFVNAKKKIDSKSLGGAIPDGFLFDFADPADPQFYIAELELYEHNFYNHVFPQITKFFAFFKNQKQQKSLVDKLFSIINTDEAIRSEFKTYLGQQEVYKFLSDIVESSQNILLISDGQIPELEEIMDTYTDTWGKLVRAIEIRRYACGNEKLYSINPDFETLQFIEGEEEPSVEEVIEEIPKYSEEYHLEGVKPIVRDIYHKIKELALAADGSLIFNTQKYYISIRSSKNIAFLKVRTKKIRFIAMMPEEDIKKIVMYYRVASLSQAVQSFYNGPCAGVDIYDLQHEDELLKLIRGLIEFHRNR